MRLTVSRWLAVAVLGGALGAVLAAPGAHDGEAPKIWREGPAQVDAPLPPDLRWEIRRQRTLTQSLRVKLTLERARAVAAAVRIGAAPIESAWVNTKTRGEVRLFNADRKIVDLADSVRRLRERTRAGSRGDVQLAIRVLPATDVLETTKIPETYRAWVALPSALDGTGCVVLYQRSWLQAYVSYNHAFGPCFWYGAFGTPGRGMQERLTETRYAGTSLLGRQAVIFSADSRRGPPVFAFELQAMSALLGPGTLALQCVAHGGDACTRASAADFWPRERMRIPASARVLPLSSAVSFHTNGALGPVLEELGAERFAKLWRSDKPFPEAFVEATGERLDQYTRRMLTRDLGFAYHAGPWLPGGATLNVLLACAALLGVTTLAGRRPTVA